MFKTWASLTLALLGLGAATSASAPRQPAKERDAELIFQQLDLMAHRRLGHVEFERGARDVQVPRSRLEGS
jgi:hypothetical protein